MKKIINVLMAVILLLNVISITVFAEDGSLYDRNGTPIKEILLDPIKVIINGKVEKYDKKII